MTRIKQLALAAILGSSVGLAGCAATATPVTGFLFTDASAPVNVTGEHAASKVGTSKAISFLGLVGLGDASISAAMEDGGISNVHHVDYHTTQLLGLYAEITVMVYGQ